MHCNPKQQVRLANMMLSHMGHLLIKYDEFAATGRMPALSPSDLRHRILVKGKVKVHAARSIVRCTSLASLALFGSRMSAGSRRSGEKQPEPARGVPRRSGEEQPEPARGASESERLTETPEATRDTLLRTSGSSSNLQRFSSTASRWSHSSDTEFVHTMAKARSKLCKTRRRSGPTSGSNSGSRSKATDEFYAEFLCLRSVPVSKFLQGAPGQLTITSISEDRLLSALCLPLAERTLIEGLHSLSLRTHAGAGLTEEQLTSRAVFRLTSNPPPEVGKLQRRTSELLLRPFPLGLRVSGKNMSPLPGWLVGAQSVALNMSNVDLALHLHYALFDGSGGYVLKPSEMRAVSTEEAVDADCIANRDGLDGDAGYWPPSREQLHRTTVDIISLHNLPKRAEARPRFRGSRGACHEHEPVLSGRLVPPTYAQDPSSPQVFFFVHTIGGFCGVSKALPLPHTVETECALSLNIKANGMNAVFGQRLHCVAAEPHATFIRIVVSDAGHEVAFESAVLGRLRRGYRVLQLRSTLGTRIELACLFVHISLGSELNIWATPRQLQRQHRRLLERIESQERLTATAALLERLTAAQVADLLESIESRCGAAAGCNTGTE
mmetsp:Transcript_10776/g.28272  ORF Transcript_10776/g.28272 Transcript_10776/m.28272 type:complete len:609 (+) Transcript_10776:1-1827(+)